MGRRPAAPSGISGIVRVCAALVVGLIGQLLVEAHDALAATGTALPIEVRAASARLSLVWPAPADATLITDAGTARLRAVIAMAPIPPDRLEALTGWVAGADLIADGHELLLRLQPDTVARLSRPHARMAVIEFGHAPLPFPAPAAAAPPTMPEPAAGPPRLPPIPVSRPVPPVAEPPPPLSAPEIALDVVRPEGSPTDAERRHVTVSAQPAADRLEMRFRWGLPMAAAMFQRGDRFWAVFPAADAEVAGWRSLERANVAAWLEPLGTARAGKVRLFRFRLARPAQLTARSDGAGWQVTLTAADGKASSPSNGITLDRIRSVGSLAAAVTGEVAQVRDPDSGEQLGVLMSARGGLRQSKPERLVDLELLPSVQGLVWRVLADGVRATVEDGRLTITRPGGLRLSTADGPPGQPPESTPSTSTLGEASPIPGLGLAGIAIADPADREARRRQIIDELHGLAGPLRVEARLELARLYLADALGPEARTALDLIEAGDIAGPAAGPQRLTRLALGGAAEALSRQPDPALVKLLDHALDEDREVALWRAYAAAQASRRELANQEWARSGGLPESYPEPLRRRLGFELAALLLEDADPAAAMTMLARLKDLKLGPEEKARLALLEGVAHAGAGAVLAAEQAYETAAASADADIATRAEFLLTDQRMKRRALTTAQGLGQLARQRPRWRGHPWEARMLARLAALQAENGQPVAAVASWREAIGASRDPGLAARLATDLRGQLVALLADTAVPTTTRLALAQAHAAELDAAPQAGEIRARLAVAAAGLGLSATAGELIAAAGPAAGAARAELARALAEAGLADAALTQASNGPDRAGKQAELTAEAPPVAEAVLARGEHAPSRPRQLRMAERRGDWQEITTLAGAELAGASPDQPLPADQAEAAVWLGLAQRKLGRAAEAADVATRYLGRIDDPAGRALLELAVLADPPAVAAESLATAAAGYATAIRASLAALPRIGGAAPIRTASAR